MWIHVSVIFRLDKTRVQNRPVFVQFILVVQRIKKGTKCLLCWMDSRCVIITPPSACFNIWRLLIVCQDRPRTFLLLESKRVFHYRLWLRPSIIINSCIINLSRKRKRTIDLTWANLNRSRLFESGNKEIVVKLTCFADWFGSKDGYFDRIRRHKHFCWLLECQILLSTSIESCLRWKRREFFAEPFESLSRAKCVTSCGVQFFYSMDFEMTMHAQTSFTFAWCPSLSDCENVLLVYLFSID